MSAFTSDWAPREAEAPVTRPVESRNAYRREEEFRSALNNYMAGYVADQEKRRAAATGSLASAAHNSYFTLFGRSSSPFRRDSARRHTWA